VTLAHHAECEIRELLGTLTGSSAPWRGNAACATADPKLFEFRALNNRGTLREVRATAQRYCSGCPVIRECAAYADAGKEQGLWGGSSRSRGASGHGPLEVTTHIPEAPISTLAEPTIREAS